jgi:hypothetical protein
MRDAWRSAAYLKGVSPSWQLAALSKYNTFGGLIMPRGNERLPDDDANRPAAFLNGPYMDPLAAWEAQQRYDASIAPARSFYDQAPKPKIFDQWDQWELSFWRIKP